MVRLKITLHLHHHLNQKLTTHWWTIQKVLIYSWQCIIYYNIVIIIPWQVDDNRSNGKPFKYKTKAMEKTLAKLPRSGNPEDTDQPIGPTLNVEENYSTQMS